MEIKSIVTVEKGQNQPNQDQLFKENEAAEFLCCSVRSLQKWRVTGGGPKFVRLNTSIRYRLRDLIEYIDQNTVGSTSEQVLQ